MLTAMMDAKARFVVGRLSWANGKDQGKPDPWCTVGNVVQDHARCNFGSYSERGASCDDLVLEEDRTVFGHAGELRGLLRGGALPLTWVSAHSSDSGDWGAIQKKTS